MVGFIAALALRIIWVTWVQAPGDEITSDMSGYISRSRTLLPNGPTIPPKNMVCYPYGTHTFYGLEQLLFGKNAYGAMGLVQAAASALVVPATMGIAWRCGLSLGAGCLLGALCALWPPAISYAGYFSSETPYALFLTTFAWAWLRWMQTGRGAWLAGVLGSVAFTIRPQVLVTFVIGLAWFWAMPSGGLSPRLRKTTPTLLFPLLIVLTFSATRHQALTGSYGLISTNSVVGRFFADTNYLRLGAIPKGKAHLADTIKPNYFHPPARSPRNGFQGEFTFVGDTCQSPKIEAERARFAAEQSLSDRLGFLQRNTALLFHRNDLWPERNHWERHPWRKTVMQGSALAVPYLLAPLALLGIFTLARRRNEGAEWLGLHGLTMLIAAARYFGEVRYRVPYDPFLFVLAGVGLQHLLQWRRPIKAPPRSYQLLVAGLSLGLLLLFFGPWMSWP